MFKRIKTFKNVLSILKTFSKHFPQLFGVGEGGGAKGVDGEEVKSSEINGFPPFPLFATCKERGVGSTLKKHFSHKINIFL